MDWRLRSISLLLLLPVACTTDPSGGDDTTTGPAGTTTTDPATSSATTAPATSTTDADGTSTGPVDPDTTTTTGEDDTTMGGGPIFDVFVPDMPGGTVPATDIDVVITADNAYAFGYGTETEMSNYFGGEAATLASQIFSCGSGPEQYIVPAEDVAEYLYIIAYGDQATTQGVIGQFRRVSRMPDGTDGDVLYTGDPNFEVCATGVDYNTGDPTPTLEVVNEQIALCNAGMTDPDTTSQGWVDETGTMLGALAVGETNENPYAGGPMPGNEFPLVCQTLVDPEARWMWFNWDPDNIVWPAQSPFIYPGGGGNPMHDFMIFRLASEAVPQPPAG